MTGQPFFFTVAGMALSVAGFAGLLTAFRRDETWTPTELWRLRGIVRLGHPVGLFIETIRSFNAARGSQ